SRGGLVDDAELEPDGSGTDRYRLVSDASGDRGVHEDIDDVDGERDLREAPVALLAVHLFCPRVHRPDLLAVLLQHASDPEGRARTVLREPDDGPRLSQLGQNPVDLRAVVDHPSTLG